MSKATPRTYFMLAPEQKLVKIGQSIAPFRRIDQIRLMSPVPVEMICVILVPEKQLHKDFEEFRHHGEWFNVDIRMVDYLHAIGESIAASRLVSVLNG